MGPLIVWGGGLGGVGATVIFGFGSPGLGRSPRGKVMWLPGGSGDGVAPTVACHRGAPCSGVRNLCSPWWAAPFQLHSPLPRCPLPPPHCPLPAGMAARRRRVVSELGSARLPPHRKLTDDVTSHIGGCTCITAVGIFVFCFV